MPMPMVRQLTARRFLENVATSSKKQTKPQAAWPRSPIASRVNAAASASPTTAAASPTRQRNGVGGNRGAGRGIGGRSVDMVRALRSVEEQRTWGRRRLTDLERLGRESCRLG